ncbi:sensor domain-containing protein [Calidifontibacillus oryziterrae]|uniref:sensor domain-containing protein n=1 Tax=Calidifontibacillus oryziterrae TaxID=1191699 RepID=UPI00030CE5A1|nr:EAL domain-containing protein [Calidifontibacillus oryziterrae]
MLDYNYLLEVMFSQNVDGCFFMVLDKPIYWNETVDREKVLDHIFDNQKITKINQAYLDQYGVSGDEMLGKTPRQIFKDNVEYGKSLWRKMLDNGKLHLEFEEKTSDGLDIVIEGTYIAFYDDEGRFEGHFGFEREITNRKKQEELIEYLAFHDEVTGLPNRRYFEKKFVELVYSDKHEKSALLFFDLDQFKFINDEFGHSCGDQVLKTVAERIKQVPRCNFVARMGGDEFVVLIHDIKDIDEALAIAREVLSLIKDPIKITGQMYTLTTSIGIACYPDDGTTFDQLLRSADAAMYKAKEKRGQIHVYDKSLQNKSVQSKLEKELRLALAKNEFELYYQPQLDYLTNNIIGYEALIRWNHPERGIVSPADFIPIAEETGLIIPIEEWVLDKACQDIKLLVRDNTSLTRIGVNISPQHFQADLVNHVVAALSKSNIPPHILDIEITEALAMHRSKQVLQQLKALKEMGVFISIDDFGTGYSSLKYLKDFPVDRIKIDQSFLQEITTKVENASIVKAILTLARNLNLFTIAEGVETQDQIKFLEQNGCYLMQGYYYSKPLPLNTLLEQKK